MSELRRYRKRRAAVVTAVKLDLDTEGFTYRKWGGTQVCKPGDWLVNNEGDVYTIDGETFEGTYELMSSGVYTKTAQVWAEVAKAAGAIETKEGVTRYRAGDYLVFNDAERVDGYAVSAERFESMYVPAESGSM